MFTVEIAETSKYNKVLPANSADEAIYTFIRHCDSFPAIRILRDGEVMARKTLKGTFIAPEWRAWQIAIHALWLWSKLKTQPKGKIMFDAAEIDLTEIEDELSLDADSWIERMLSWFGLHVQ